MLLNPIHFIFIFLCRLIYLERKKKRHHFQKKTQVTCGLGLREMMTTVDDLIPFQLIIKLQI